MVDDFFSGGTHLRIAEEQAAIVNERRRIARDIHDGAAQQFAHVLHKLELIQHILASEPQPSHRVPLALMEVERAQHILQAGLADLRASIASLLPAQLEKQDLDAALQTLLQECMLNHPDLKISDNLEDLPPLSSTLEITIFRFIQEALNNACAHGRATHISIRVERKPHALELTVSDNGSGLQARTGCTWNKVDDGQHMGLYAMRSRIKQVGGSWQVESRPGAGTTVLARFPLDS
jgi:signal transduction histidine kinase